MILLTRFHRSTEIMRTLCRNLECSIPNLARAKRRKMRLYELAEESNEKGSGKVVVIDRSERGSGRIRLLEMSKEIQITFAMSIFAIRPQREFKNMRNPVRSIFIERTNRNNLELQTLTEDPSDLLKIPVMKTEQAENRYNTAMCFPSASEGPARISFHDLSNNAEKGPRPTIGHMVWET